MMNKDCLHYEGSKPCHFHKTTKVLCPDCVDYIRVTERVLIVKLGAMGDVLRTTAILHQICSSPSVQVTWITQSESVDMLTNAYIHRVIDVRSPSLVPLLLAKQFDKVYSLDNSEEGAVLGQLAKSPHKRGYGVNAQGVLFGFTPEAEAWLDVSTNDVLKKSNTDTYQRHLFGVCGFLFSPERDTMVLPTGWTTSDVRHVQTEIVSARPVWAVVTGAGARWPYKSISRGRQSALIAMLVANAIPVVLIGGEAEKAVVAELKQEFGDHVIDSGASNSVLQLIHILSLCDVVVTSDSLSMHIGIALKKRVYAYVGPTSAYELERYGVMTVLQPDLDCVCCYKTACDQPQKCNDVFAWDDLVTREGLTG